MEVKKYQITKMNSVKGINRIVNEIKKIDTIFNATIDKTTKILIVECNAPEQEFKQEAYYKKLEDKIIKAIRMYEKQAKMVSIDNVEVYRKVLYLNGLDCAYCGTRVENLAKKEFNHQRIVVDYPTYRFIIETTDKALVDNLEQRVTEIAHKVDDRIVVTSPGPMPSGELINKELNNNIPSIRRNPILADIFARMKFMDRRGSGFDKIINGTNRLFDDNKNHVEFYATETHFSVVIYNANYNNVENGVTNGVINDVINGALNENEKIVGFCFISICIVPQPLSLLIKVVQHFQFVLIAIFLSLGK